MAKVRKITILDSFNAVMAQKASVQTVRRGKALKIDSTLFATQVSSPISPLVKNIPVLMVKSTAN